MPTLLAPLIKEFTVKGVEGIPDDDPITVTFRQATQGQELKREEMLTRTLRRKWDGDNSLEFAEEPTPFSKRMAVDCWLTMVSCNIFDGKTELFSESFMKTAKFEDFITRFNKLPSAWANAMYQRCLKVNPDWGFGVTGEDDDSEALTEGNENAGEPATE